MAVYRLLAPIILIFFVLSGLPWPSGQQQGDGIELRRVIEQIQILSGQTTSRTLDFAQSFRSTMTALQAGAGLKTIIVKKPTRDGDHTSAVIVCINLPYLPTTIPNLDINISSSDLSISKRLIVDTSVILSLDTPPPIV